VERSGVRRKLLKAQAEAGDIVLLFGDESEALTHPYLAHAWAKKGADLRIPAPGQAAKVALLGVLDWAPRTLVVHTSRTKRSTDFIALLETGVMVLSREATASRWCSCSTTARSIRARRAAPPWPHGHIG
jgi:hypothetical protein